MNKNIKPIDESKRSIDWEEVEYKIAIICRKFNNIDPRYQDDLAQELRIHAYYFSDDYYDLQRKAIDFWRSFQVRVMPEIPYFDLELFGGIKEDTTSVQLHELVSKISSSINSSEFKIDSDIRSLASDIFNVILDDIIERNPKMRVREYKKYKPYHNNRISCSYLWEVMGSSEGDIPYRNIRKAMKFLEAVVKKLAQQGQIDIDDVYLE